MNCKHVKVRVQTNMCEKCGAELSIPQLQKYYKRDQIYYVKKTVFKKNEDRFTSEVISQNKIVMLLDIDNTMIQAVEVSQPAKGVPTDIELLGKFSGELNKSYSLYYKYLSGIRSCQISLNDPSGGNVYYFVIFFRPGIFGFIHDLRDNAVFHISTTGTECYARKIVKIIDPLGQVFVHVIAREQQDYEQEVAICPYANMVATADDKYQRTALKHFKNIPDVLKPRTIALDDNSRVWRNCGYCDNILKSVVYVFRPESFMDMLGNAAMTFHPCTAQDLEDCGVLAKRSLDMSFLAEIQLRSYRNVVQLLCKTQDVDAGAELRRLRRDIFRGTLFVYFGRLAPFCKKIFDEFGIESAKYEANTDHQVVGKQVYYFIQCNEDARRSQYLMENFRAYCNSSQFPKLYELFQRCLHNLDKTDQKPAVRYFNYRAYGDSDDESELAPVRKHAEQCGLRLVDTLFLLTSCYLLCRQDYVYWYVNWAWKMTNEK